MPVVFRPPSVSPQTLVDLRTGVGRRDGDDRQAGGQRDSLGQTGRRAAADADTIASTSWSAAAVPGALGDLDRHVHDDLVVPVHNRQAARHTLSQLSLRLARDHHQPSSAELFDLLGELLCRLTRGEADSLAQRLVDESLHQMLRAEPVGSATPASFRASSQPTPPFEHGAQLDEELSVLEREHRGQLALMTVEDDRTVGAALTDDVLGTADPAGELHPHAVLIGPEVRAPLHRARCCRRGPSARR